MIQQGPLSEEERNLSYDGFKWVASGCLSNCCGLGTRFVIKLHFQVRQMITSSQFSGYFMALVFFRCFLSDV
jgi:hypothetical protein